jgi:hypothetical protein
MSAPEAIDKRPAAAVQRDSAPAPDAALTNARRSLIRKLVESGRADEAYGPLGEELAAGSSWIDALITHAMAARDLRAAGDYVRILAALRHGSGWYPAPDLQTYIPAAAPQALNLSKLRHDIEQFKYLRERNIVGGEFDRIIAAYEGVTERLTSKGVRGPTPFDAEASRDIGSIYSRIVHIRDAPRLARALSPEWDPGAVEHEYLSKPPGVVVVDNFLTREALESLRLFCLESTIWSTCKSLGRLGALFREGFSCPLLFQIAEELRDTLPNLIGERYPLRHMWGYKTPPRLAADSITHADFAAVNVNFWITPDEANLNERSGGLIVYGVDAPAHWDFHTYNGRLEDVIKPYLRQQKARAVTIPYRQNRAVIFNSDLFHSTDEVTFLENYEHRRINITMLYGIREDDVHHRGLGRPAAPPPPPAGTAKAWRSLAFSRSRR